MPSSDCFLSLYPSASSCSAGSGAIYTYATYGLGIGTCTPSPCQGTSIVQTTTCPTKTSIGSGGSTSFLTTGFVIIEARYLSTDTSCKQNPTYMLYVPVGACTALGYNGGSQQYTVDSSFNVYNIQYSDTACSKGAKTVSQLSVLCGGSSSINQYSALSPDINVNAKGKDQWVAGSIQYASTDTKCANSPISVTVGRTQNCIPSPTGESSTQYVVDGSNNLYYQQFVGSLTCTATASGLIQLVLFPPTICSSTQFSNYVFLGSLSPSLTSSATSMIQ